MHRSEEWVEWAQVWRYECEICGQVWYTPQHLCLACPVIAPLVTEHLMGFNDAHTSFASERNPIKEDMMRAAILAARESGGDGGEEE